MRKLGRVALAGIVCLGFILTLVPFHTGYAQEKELQLKCANFFPPPSRQSKIMEDFIADLEQRTGGRVKVRYFAGGSLLKSTTMIDGIEKGIADIGVSHIEYTPGRMPVMEAAELPLAYPTGWVANQIMNDFYLKTKPKEMDTVHPMWWHANSPSTLHTTKAVRTLEDLKGLTIRAPGIIGDVIKALGGTPAPMPAPETYDSMSKGVIQGAFMGTEAQKNFRLAEVSKFLTNSWMVGPSYPMYVIINKNTYKKFSPEIRSIFDELCGEYRDRFALMWNAIDFEGIAAAKANKVEYIDLSKEEGQRWEKAVQSVIEDYVKRMTSRGFAEPEIRGWIKYLKERTAYWTQKQMDFHITSVTGPPEMRP
jgi:TRAP-type C4-dicarboxylate transport system substrate-binding protein